MGMAAFLGFALAGCSDDVIDVNNQEQQVSNEPAYLSVSFSVNSSSSRSTADDANNKGDGHGTAEDSQHSNAGSIMENTITKALIVVKGINKNDVFAKVYEAPENGFPTSTEQEHTKCYILAEDIEMTTGEYDVLVVANPHPSIYEDKTVESQVGDRDFNRVTALYNNILDGKYIAGTETDLGGNGDNFAGDILNTNTTGDEFTGIMMANRRIGDKDNKPVKLEAASTTIADVELERVASKITFRNTYKTDGNTQLAANVYPVNVPDINSAVIKSYTIKNTTETTITETTYQLASLNGKKYWVVTKNSEGKETYTFYGYDNDDQTTFSEPLTDMVEIEKPNGLQWIYDANKYKNKKWYVKLEEFALVNLSKQVYNVRHTITDGSVISFGTLDGSNYIYTPNWESEFNGGINNVSFTNGEFEEGFKTNPWFFNTLADVSEDSKNRGANETRKYFRQLPTGEDPDFGVVDGNEHYDSDPTLPNIGNLLAYCLENTTDVNHQIHGLSTGITFMGKIYDENMQPITTLFRYNGHLFEHINDIKKAYGIKQGSAGWDNLNDQSDSEECAKVGITKYESNICYYYTTEIKHFDNGYPGYNGDDIKLGNMEFAIVRNNIYSLSVANVNIIGDPWVDPTPSTEDEIEKPKLEVHATILPWIVRYHDIEFN